MIDIKRLLSFTYTDATVEIATADDSVHENVRLTFDKKEDVSYVTSIMEGAGYYLTSDHSEFAAQNILDFTNQSPYDGLSEVSEYDDEIETVDGDRSDIDIASSAGDISSPIDSDGRAFRVLTTPDMHKFAMKVYTSMLGNNENMSNYGIFAYDLDNFLSMHRNTDPSFDDDEEDDEDSDETPNVPEAATSALAYMTVEEASQVLFNSDVSTFFNHFKSHIPETANHRFIAKVILGILVKIVGGALGKALLDAWNRRNKGLFERLLFSIVKIVVNDWFPSEEFSYASETKKYNKYAFDDDYKYEIDLDDYTVETSEQASVEVSMSPGTVGILRLLIAVFIKIMAGALGRMLIDAWIKRDKKTFEKSFMYFMLQAIKYVPFRESASDESSIEVFDDGSTFIHSDSLSETENVYETEIAKKKREKTGRGALLSALMRALSGDNGDRAARAWDNGDFEAMGEIMAAVTEKVMEAMPVDEDEVEEEVETTEETVSDEPKALDDIE